MLLAATFEEYIRQQVRAAFEEKTKHAKSIGDFPTKIASTVWKRSLEILARTPFEEIELDGRKTDARLAATLSFCLRKEITADVSETLSHNETNMRSRELNRLFKQIGLQSIISKSCEEAELIAFLGADTAEQANALLESRFENFFRRRNEIAHAIKLGNSSGPSELHHDIEMFRTFGRALSTAVQRMIALSLARAAPDPSAAAS